VSFLSDPLSYDFFPRALLAASLVFALGALAGVSIKARGQIYLGQGISQSLIAGVAAAALKGMYGFLASFLAAILAAVLVDIITRFFRTSFDVAIAVVSSTLMSLGIAFLSMNRDSAVNVTNILFGNVLGVTPQDVLLILGVFIVTGSFFVVFARKIVLSALALPVARSQGVKTQILLTSQLVFVSLAIASFVQVAGTLLSIVALVIPTATAQLLSRSLGPQHYIGAVVGVLAAITGLFISFYTNIPSGPAITLVASMFFVVAFFLSSFIYRKKNATARHEVVE
jgi:ABC-type Mn2+/Zn2+ transport system permease subunit